MVKRQFKCWRQDSGREKGFGYIKKGKSKGVTEEVILVASPLDKNDRSLVTAWQVRPFKTKFTRRFGNDIKSKKAQSFAHSYMRKHDKC